MKAIAVLLGHASSIITFENYTDKNEIINDCLEEMEPFIESVLPEENSKQCVCDCTDIETDIIMQNTFRKILAA